MGRFGDAAARVHVSLLRRVRLEVLGHAWLLRRGRRGIWRHGHDDRWWHMVITDLVGIIVPLAPHEIEQEGADGGQGDDAANHASHNGCYGC